MTKDLFFGASILGVVSFVAAALVFHDPHYLIGAVLSFIILCFIAKHDYDERDI